MPRGPHNVKPYRRSSDNLRALIGGPFERAAQANVALVISQALVILLSLKMRETSDGEPDVLVLLGFLLACVGTVAIAVALYRVIRSLPRRAVRVASAIISIAIQAAAFQLLVEIAA